MNKQAKLQSRAARLAQAEAARRRRKLAWISAAVVALLGVTGVAGFVIYQVRQPETRVALPAAVTEDRNGIVLGSGPVTVEVYSDFLCPACKAFEADTRDEIDELLAADRIRLVYRPVAILDRLSTNKYSTRSAAGAGCAAEAGRLIPYAKVLFDNQPAEGGRGYDDEELIRLAGGAGITDARFRQCVKDGRYVAWVKQVTETMEPNDVRGTPTVIVNGTQLQQPTGERLVAAVAAGGVRE